MATVIDVHQDGFSRYTSRGAGSGFPRWAVSSRCRPYTPDNGIGSRNWPFRMITDPVMHRSFADFFADRDGVRGRYLEMIRRAAASFASTPGLIGYDLLNEPWGDERPQLAPLYRDEARAIQQADPDAILFVQGHIATNCGLRTRLPRPDYGPSVYAPHYYCPITYAIGRWHGTHLGLSRAFSGMVETARRWETPLFVGEFGIGAEIPGAGDYVRAFYDRLDAALASGAQWNYTPRWNLEDRDGWNGEDFSILETSGSLRANFRPRPYPRATAGMPLRFHFDDHPEVGLTPRIEFEWEHDPAFGETEIFVPSSVFPRGTAIDIVGPSASYLHETDRQVLVCRAARPGTVRLQVTAPSLVIPLVAASSSDPRRLPVDTRVRVC